MHVKDKDSEGQGKGSLHWDKNGTEGILREERTCNPKRERKCSRLHTFSMKKSLKGLAKTGKLIVRSSMTFKLPGRKVINDHYLRRIVWLATSAPLA